MLTIYLTARRPVAGALVLLVGAGLAMGVGTAGFSALVLATAVLSLVSLLTVVLRARPGLRRDLWSFLLGGLGAVMCWTALGPEALGRPFLLLTTIVSIVAATIATILQADSQAATTRDRLG